MRDGTSLCPEEIERTGGTEKGRDTELAPEKRVSRRIWLSAVAIIVGAGMLVLAACGGGGSSSNTTTSNTVGTTTTGGGGTTTAPAKTGGTMKLNMSNTDVD